MTVQRVVLLSGRVASGKSELGKRLVEDHAFFPIKTRELIQKHYPKVKTERRALQRAGDRLDRETSGEWIARNRSALWLRPALGGEMPVLWQRTA